MLTAIYLLIPSLSLSPLPFPFLRINMCPNNCSGRGVCRLANSSDVVQCECEEGWKGDACDVPYCASNCGYPVRGRCQISDKRCLCNPDWQGGPPLCVSANETIIIFPETGLNRASVSLYFSHYTSVNGRFHYCSSVKCQLARDSWLV